MRRFIGTVVFLSASLAVGGLWAAEKPNLVVISSDDHRWDCMGAAGHPTMVTPHMDGLAKEGVYFRQATVPVSQCLPIRATLLTGLATHTHGAYAHQNQRPEASRADSFSDQPTLPGLLRGAGYETVLVGKWHLASDPWRVGFSRVGTWLPRGASLFVDPALAHGESRETVTVEGFIQEIFADEAVAFLGSDEARAKPFLLWLAFTAPHVPMEPNPERFQKLYSEVDPLDLRPPGFPRGIRANDWLHYAESISHLDEQLGRVLAAIEGAGLGESTVVVFFGDNGHMMGARGLGELTGAGKVVPYEGSVRVPMMVRAPGTQRFAGASELAVSVLDLPPTLLALAGVEVPASWPGRDLRPALADRQAAGFEDAFSEWVDDQSEPFGALAHRLVRTPSHKLIVWQEPERPDELYDLVADPREETNLAGTPEAAAIEADLRLRLRSWLERTSDPALAWPKLLAPPAESAAPPAADGSGSPGD